MRNAHWLFVGACITMAVAGCGRPTTLANGQDHTPVATQPLPLQPAALTGVSLEAFRARVIGRTKTEVMDALGRPDHIDDGWWYANLNLHDRTTGTPYRSYIVVDFGDGDVAIAVRPED